MIERLQQNVVRSTTAKNYLTVWRLFNKFLIRLDKKPKFWEDRTTMFCAYMIDKGTTQSSTVKSYVSAIKCILKIDGYKWRDDQVVLSSLTKACRLANDCRSCKLPIQRPLLEMILFEICRVYENQLYLCKLYQAIYILGYYGLMRVGEMTQGDHPVKACNVHMGHKKNKILLILYSSKTHSRANPPQKIKISELQEHNNQQAKKRNTVLFCPFSILRKYIEARGGFLSMDENFFVFKDKSAVKPKHTNDVLKKCLSRMNLDHTLYSIHGLRSGRACDMLKQGFSIEHIKYVGRWKSNAVYKYLKL